MKNKLKRYSSAVLLLVVIIFCGFVNAQSVSINGQASGWMLSNPESSYISQAGVRYIPELFTGKSLTDDLYLDAELSVNSYFYGNFNNWENTSSEYKIKPHRLWARLTTNQFEARIGLQKINFGSALLFRPLMWFDRIDPRDPLKLTDGVYGVLCRYYFENNTNIWLWGLYGNDETKGWEMLPTKNKTIEFGGRLQVPLFEGEAALTWHHRKADLSKIPFTSRLTDDVSVSEDRFGFDGKWEAEIGFWFEGALVHKDIEIPAMRYQRLYTIGADYTFDIGNGLNVIGEYFTSETSEEVLDKGDGISFSGLSLNYPLSMLDNISGIFYRDWTNEQNYYLMHWQRTYDNWSFYVIGFWNPDVVLLNQAQTGNNPFAGKGLQIMAVFNH